jgi:hypothetical protein
MGKISPRKVARKTRHKRYGSRQATAREWQETQDNNRRLLQCLNVRNVEHVVDGSM